MSQDVETEHGGTCGMCDAYPVPTKGGLCPSCRAVVESPKPATGAAS